MPIPAMVSRRSHAWSRLGLAVVPALLGSMAACTQEAATLPLTMDISAATDSDDRPADLPDNRPQRPKFPGGLGCGWQVASDINVTNVAFPDESAKYWVAILPHVPGARLRIDGRFGHMRYFSFNVYDPLLRPVDALADEELLANDNLDNPFINPKAPLGGGYTAYLEFTAKPEQPAPNTLYSGAIPSGDNALPNPVGTAIFYRSYVPEAGFAFDGGVGLPVLTLETTDGAQELVPFADCDEPAVPTLGGNVPDPGLNGVLLGLDLPDELLGLINFPTAVMPPRSQVFYGLPTTLLNIAGNLLGIPLGEQPSGLPLSGGGGFLSNIHNAYISVPFSRYFGSHYMVRARAPSWRGAPGLTWNQEQMRYWSVCQNEFATQRFVACARDDQTAIDEQGFFTVMVTDPADRPQWATRENGITWLPWGPFPDGLIIYRHMLPNPGFDQAIQNVPQGTAIEEVMADYQPVGAYCYPEQLEQAPDNAAELFQRCLEATLEQGEQTGLLPGLLPGT
nr:hypothetical protein [Oceanococcus sp. HetDA_MAG_MS8]